MMKRTRKELKTLAKRALLGNYGIVVGSMLLGYLALFAMLIPMIVAILLALFAQMSIGSSSTGMIVGLFIGMGVWYILVLIVGTLFMLGNTRICYLCCIGQEGKLGDLLYAFKNHPLRFIGLSLLIMLLSLLGAVPGVFLMIYGQLIVTGGVGTVLYLLGYALVFLLTIVVTLRYSMAIFVLLEEPHRKVGECIRLSKDMMDGNKMRMLKFQISFIGLLMLNYLTFGLGSLWITPYMTSANLCFYLSVKEEKYSVVSDTYENIMNV